jgi:nicotinamide riboside kinase
MQAQPCPHPPGRVIAILGAESTGKTTLARALQRSLAQHAEPVALVEEVLREFCAIHGRTPRRDEQAAIASEQSRRIASARAEHRFVIADTTALQIAVYSEFVFDDTTLYAQSLAAHGAVALTLLTALDLPWIPDGHQRDGEHVRAPVDKLLRDALNHPPIAYSVIHGAGPARLDAALAAVRSALKLTRAEPEAKTQTPPRWHGLCDRCGDPNCERRLLAR